MVPKQMSLPTQHDAGFERHSSRPCASCSRRRCIIQVGPWAELCEVIAPHYPKESEPGAGGRRAVGQERLLRIHSLQHGMR